MILNDIILVSRIVWFVSVAAYAHAGVDWLIGWLNNWLINWLIDWLIDRRFAWMIEWLNNWLLLSHPQDDYILSLAKCTFGLWPIHKYELPKPFQPNRRTSSHCETQEVYIYTPGSLTARPWKRVVGRQAFPKYWGPVTFRWQTRC